MCRASGWTPDAAYLLLATARAARTFHCALVMSVQPDLDTANTFFQSAITVVIDCRVELDMQACWEVGNLSRIC